MHVLLLPESDAATSRSDAAFLSRVLHEALGHYGERVTRVVARLHGAEACADGTFDGVRCTLEATAIGLEHVVVHGRARFAAHAICRAVGKLDRTLAPFMALPLRGASLRPASGECLDEALSA